MMRNQGQPCEAASGSACTNLSRATFGTNPQPSIKERIGIKLECECCRQRGSIPRDTPGNVARLHAGARKRSGNPQ